MTPNQALQALLSSFPRQDASDPALAATAYLFAIEGVDPDGVVDAVKRFIQGRVESHDPRFCPTPAQLAQEARQCAARIRWERERPAMLAIEQKKAKEIPFMSEGDMLKQRQRVAALADRLCGRDSKPEIAWARAEVDARFAEGRGKSE